MDAVVAPNSRPTSAPTEGADVFLAALGLRGDPLPEAVLDEIEGRLTRPYPGMRSFSDGESGVFFGRREPVAELIDLLGSRQILIVLGGSGSGKSSVVRAGLIPELRLARAISRQTGRWYVSSFMPGREPVQELLAGLWRDVMAEHPPAATDRAVRVIGGPSSTLVQDGSGPTSDAVRDAFFKGLAGAGRLDAGALMRFASEALNDLDIEINGRVRGGPPSLILLMDQFEEIFKDDVDPAQRDDILALLQAVFDGAQAGHAPGFFIAVTLRSEELHRCAEFRALPNVVNKSFYLLELIDEAALRDAIIRPARLVFEDWNIPLDAGDPLAPFAPEVVGTLLARSQDVREGGTHRPDQLPLLQHALKLTWANALDRWAKLPPGTPLTVEADDLPPPASHVDRGYLNGCLDLAADDAFEHAIEAYTDLTRTSTAWDEARWLLRVVFVSMAQRDDRGNWVRRLLTGRHISAIVRDLPVALARGSSDRLPAVKAAMNVLVDHGYVAVRHSGQEWDDRQFEVCHEALIRGWNRYEGWLKEALAVSRALRDVVATVGEGVEPWLLKDYSLSPPGFWSWLRARKELAARDLIPVAHREQLQKIFCETPIFGQGWVQEQIALNMKSGGSTILSRRPGQ